MVVELDLDAAARTLTAEALATRPATLVRFRELVPLLDVDPTLMPIVTPLVEAPRIARSAGVAAVWIKDETTQPSGSLKIRASAVAIARARAVGKSAVACASSGNAATAMAAAAAADGLRATVFVPRRVPPQKLLQLRAYGAVVVVVDGSYEQAYRLCEEAAATFDWYNRNCARNPYLVEGKKTCGLEIAEQTRDTPPDWVVVPVGDGCTITGIWKGLWEMARLGLVQHTPRMLGVQAERAASIHDAWREDCSIETVEGRYSSADTLADSIAVTHPHNGQRAIEAIRASGGAFVTVDDETIVDAALALARDAGVFVEPASASTLAGVRAARERGIVAPDARVVLVGTGTGFKNPEPIARALGGMPPPVAPSLDALAAYLESFS